MKAVVSHGISDIRLDDIAGPKIKESTEAIVRITSSAICGTDLHMIRGTFAGMKPGTILGHEDVGIVKEVGKGVRNLRRGDRVVIPSTIACDNCSYCRSGYTTQCDDANPNGPTAGTAFFGGPAETGPFDGLQAEYARVPFAYHNLIRLPQEVSDDQAILLSDIYPTAWFGARLAEVGDGDVVAVWGCGPVGLFAVMSAFQQGVHRVSPSTAMPTGWSTPACLAPRRSTSTRKPSRGYQGTDPRHRPRPRHRLHRRRQQAAEAGLGGAGGG